MRVGIVFVALAVAGCSSSSETPCSPAENLDGGAPYTELPSGACAGAETCGYLVERPCASSPAPVDRWTCACEGGTWSCTLTAAATTICADVDAGTD